VLPLIEPFFAVKKFPLGSDVLRVDLEFHALLGDPFPTDFSFGHEWIGFLAREDN
jgi:hypothetical protein